MVFVGMREANEHHVPPVEFFGSTLSPLLSNITKASSPEKDTRIPWSFFLTRIVTPAFERETTDGVRATSVLAESSPKAVFAALTSNFPPSERSACTIPAPVGDKHSSNW